MTEARLGVWARSTNTRKILLRYEGQAVCLHSTPGCVSSQKHVVLAESKCWHSVTRFEDTSLLQEMLKEVDEGWWRTLMKEVDDCWLWIAWGCAWEYVCMLAENTVVKGYGSYWSIRIWMGGYYFIELTSNITGNWLKFRIKLLHRTDCSSKFCLAFK